MNKQERLFALKISLIMGFRMLGLFMILPIFSIYAHHFDNTTPYLIGLAIGIYGLSQALLQIPFAYLSDQLGRKPLLIVGLIIFFIGSVMAANATDIIEIIIARALQGSGAISAVLMAFLADYVAPERRMRANAFVGMQIGVAFTLSLLLGPVVAANVGISGLFWLIAALSLVALLIVTTLPNTKPKTQYVLSVANFKQLLNASLLKLYFSVFALHLILTCTFVVLPLFLLNHNIVDAKDQWQLYLPVILLSFIGLVPIILLTEKLKKTKAMLLLSIGLLFSSQILLYTLQDSSSVFAISYPTIFVLLSLFFIGFNALETMLPSLIAKTASSNKRGLAMGLFSTSQFFGAFVGGVFGGWLYDIFDLNSVFLFSAFIAVIWWIIMLSVKPQN